MQILPQVGLQKQAFESQKLLEKSQYNLWQTITPHLKKLF